MGKLNWCRMSLLRPISAMECEPSSRHALARRRVAFAARGVLAVCVALALAACSGAPTKSDRDSAAPDGAISGASASKSGSADVSAAPAGAGGAVAGGASGTANPSAQPDIPKRALTDFDRAVGLMKAGNSGEAELEFKTLAAGYPQLA